jgi:multidrug efflux pump subunit AcrA (membrane-fusion protein)
MMSYLDAQTIELSQKQEQDLGIKLQKTTKIDHVPIGPYNAKVVLDQRDLIYVGSSIDAVVKDIYVRTLEHVKKGQKLISISSNELLSLQEEYIKSLIENNNINKNYERAEKLLQKGLVSNKSFLDAQKKKQSSDLKLKLSKSKLLSSGFNEELLKRLADTHQSIMQINLLSPRDGTLQSIDVNIGQKVESNQNMMKIFADAPRCLEISVPIKDIKNISLGDVCEFDSYKAKVVAIGSVVNTESQSVVVRAKIEDSKDIMINRIYSTSIKKNVKGALKIKKSALVFDGKKSYVFKKVKEGFEVVEVELINEGPVCYVISSTLSEGDMVAATSTSALLSAMEVDDE